ncbi:MAG: pilus assembly protein N-terminal domain-containing protein [Candidatus Acidiferrales bacterium]
MSHLNCDTNRNAGIRAALASVVMAAALLAGAAGAKAQQAQPDAAAITAMAQAVPAATQATAGAVQQTPTQPAAAESEGPQTLHLLVGRSLVITSPTKIKRVSLADPAIAEAIVVSPYQVLVNGKTPGGVSLLLWDEADQSQAFEVSVDIDILGLTQKIHEVFPAEAVQVETSRDMVIVSGKVSSAALADKILEVVKAAAPKVTSLMEVPAMPDAEILLEVKFADVNRTLESQLGINILSLPGAKNIGIISTQQFSPPQLVAPTTGTGSSGTTSALGLSNLLNIFIFRPDIDFAATIQALETNNILQILAEPNLMTESGKEASFLAGGEFPFPILQGTGAGGFAGITIQFKEFGVRLNFTPTLTPDGLIHLKVKPEVSSLDFTNALTIQGFLIPALATNRAESDVVLRDGQSFAMAGLLDNRVTEEFNKIPWIGDVPVLGNLFKSRSLTKSKNELLIVVTPRIVHPSDSALPTPAMPKAFLGATVPAAAPAQSPK